MSADFGGRPRRRPEGLLPDVSASAGGAMRIARVDPPPWSAWFKDCVRALVAAAQPLVQPSMNSFRSAIGHSPLFFPKG
jgi:hypothetical protein